MPFTADTPVLPDRLMAFTFGFAPPLMIEAAIRHGVFNALDKGAKTVDALCVETGTSQRGLRIVLNALVGLDVLSKNEAGRYALTEESTTFLVSGKPMTNEVTAPRSGFDFEGTALTTVTRIDRVLPGRTGLTQRNSSPPGEPRLATLVR